MMEAVGRMLAQITDEFAVSQRRNRRRGITLDITQIKRAFRHRDNGLTFLDIIPVADLVPRTSSLS